MTSRERRGTVMEEQGHPNGWPLSDDDEGVFRDELGERAWSWAQDCNPHELNTEWVGYIAGAVEDDFS